MITFVEQIETALGLQVFTIPGTTVKQTYDVKTPVYPLITIEEMPSNDGIEVDGQPRIVSNRYVIECYCRATALTGLTLSANTSARTLGLEVDTYLNETFNFKQVGDALCRPINVDKSVYRWIARYTTVIDQSNGYIYR